MNTLVVYLIVTMGSSLGMGHRGYGGVSVTPTTNMEECLWLKNVVSAQIRRTDFLEFDDNEIILECRKR